MGKDHYSVAMRIGVAVFFLLMVTVNAVANLLPLNGLNTGQVSDSYPNIFAPAGLTFSIWGVIYVLLALYTLYQFGLFQKAGRTSDPGLLKSVGGYFMVSSLANAAWIFAWHFNQILLSMVLMIVILLCLIFINNKFRNTRLSGREKFFLRLPFSIYFGWITVATIANFTVLLVALDWNAFGISESVWAAIIIIVGMLIGSVTMIRNRDIAYGLVLIWAYFGILIKHISGFGFQSQYPTVIAVVVACIVIFLFAELYILVSNRRIMH